MDGACQSRQKEDQLEDQLLQLTMSSQTPRLVLTKDLLDSQLTMETIAIQHPMHSEVAPNSLTPMPVKDNGGKLVSTETTGLIESESLTEETAVVGAMRWSEEMAVMLAPCHARPALRCCRRARRNHRVPRRACARAPGFPSRGANVAVEENAAMKRRLGVAMRKK